MVKLIDRFIKVSGENEEERLKKEFSRLASKVSPTSKKLKSAAIEVKKGLDREGFAYDPLLFRAGDLLLKRKGNCLGRPLLIGSLLENFGFYPKYKLVIGPKDEVYKLEHKSVERIDREMPYDRPELAICKEECSYYRFAPLEHLTLDVNNGLLFETTSEDPWLGDYEVAIPVTKDCILSCVYKDRAVDAHCAGDEEKAKNLVLRAISLWDKNREALALLAEISYNKSDKREYEENIRKYLRIGGKDSRFYLNSYLFTGDKEDLEQALKIYPPYAQAIKEKAKSLTETYPREARFLFAKASQLYSNSNSLDLRRFYIENAEDLKKLFGKDRIKEVLKSFITK